MGRQLNIWVNLKRNFEEVPKEYERTLPIFVIFLLLTFPLHLHPGCPAKHELSQHLLTLSTASTIIARSYLGAQFVSEFKARHYWAVCDLCTLLNGEVWTRARFSPTVLHLSVSALCTFPILSWSEIREKEPEVASFWARGLTTEVNWTETSLRQLQQIHNLKRSKSTLIFENPKQPWFKNGDQPERVTQGSQRLPPCPQLRDNTPLETVIEITFVSIWNSWICTKLRNWNTFENLAEMRRVRLFEIGL